MSVSVFGAGDVGRATRRHALGVLLHAGCTVSSSLVIASPARSRFVGCADVSAHFGRKEGLHRIDSKLKFAR
jgi:hypothetical protein